MAAGARLTLLLFFFVLALCLPTAHALSDGAVRLALYSERHALRGESRALRGERVFLVSRSAERGLLAHSTEVLPAILSRREVLPPTEVVLPRTAELVNTTAGLQVIDGEGNTVAQGSASDGSGSGLDVPAIIWIGVSLSVGAPMLLAGIRGWRLTTGVGIGVSAAVCAWAAFINAINEDGLPDLVLTAIVGGFFVLGFILGVFEVGRIGGIALIGLAGGLAFGVRVAIIKEGLLFPVDTLFALNWVVCAIFGVANGLLILWRQRAGLVLGCASIGAFLVSLGVDLIMNKQDGISRGLRLLFDQNASHLDLADGYHPVLTTRIIIYASLGATPVFAYAQHRIFRHPFSRKPVPDDSALQEDYSESITAKWRTTTGSWLQSIWDGAQHKDPKRFTVV
ncbi:hypothetical protein BD626DRAFT_3528 [Schizophyllum amplum]|uniref:TM7S3/TM198-like domain-containing protein n=1 Tax=Schizophyllum amplum TaxID=97359 RepID=A0A550CVZ4_9AGAR|nr:hypothetical protein BD626DRAFT_3528 [Auriculariopsis ampla]